MIAQDPARTPPEPPPALSGNRMDGETFLPGGRLNLIPQDAARTPKSLLPGRIGADCYSDVTNVRSSDFCGTSDAAERILPSIFLALFTHTSTPAQKRVQIESKRFFLGPILDTPPQGITW